MAAHSSYHEAQQLLDEEIADLTARMQQAIRMLKARRNELAPVSKLPDEVLQHIFLIFRDSTDLDPKNWQQVTQICQYWRHVAVELPSLWTLLYDPPHALVPLMLERSQSAPLEFGLLTLKSEHSITTLTTVLPEIERIRTLNLRLMPFDILDTVHDIFAGLDQNWEASLLESLAIGTMPNRRLRAADPVKLAMDVFRPTRRLRRLTLLASGGYYNWSMLPLPNLTHLTLYGEPLGQVSGSQFIETLRHMQNLETLKLKWENIHIRQFPPTPRPQPIHLPSIRRLEIAGVSHIHLESFLSLVVHPNLQRLEVSLSGPTPNVVTFTQSLLSSTRQANFGPLEFLKIGFGDIILSAMPSPSRWNGPFIHIHMPMNPVPGIDDNSRSSQFVVDIMSCMTAFDHPDTILLRHLSLSGNWDTSIDEFTHLFAPLPHLETIKVHQKLALHLFKALNIGPASDGAIPHTPIPFSKLQSIILHGEPEYSRPILSAAVFNDLYGGLLSRYSHGVPINKLELVDCERLDDIQANQLEEIGVKIIARWSLPLIEE